MSVNNVKKTINKKYHKFVPSTNNIKQMTKMKYSLAKFQYEITDQIKAIILIVLILILVLLFYFLIYKKKPFIRQKTFLNRTRKGHIDPYDFHKTFKIKYKNTLTTGKNKHKKNIVHYIPNSMLRLASSDTSYVVSFWTVINQWNKNNWVHLLSFTDPANCSSNEGSSKIITNECKQFPGFWLSPRTNRLNVCLDTTGTTRELVTIDNIPLRKWFNITCVIDNYAVGIYIDGKLTNSHVLEAKPLVLAETGNLYINQSQNQSSENIIQMAYVQMFAKYLNPKKVYELYEQYLPKITSYDTYLYNKMNLKDISPFMETKVKTDMNFIQENDVFEYDPSDD